MQNPPHPARFRPLTVLPLALFAASAHATVLTMEGEIEIVGNVVNMKLAGPLPGNDPDNHDKFIFPGPVTLTDLPLLNVVLTNDYRPPVDTAFDLFDWGDSVSGEFALSLPADGYEWDVSALYSSGEIVVTAVPIPEPEAWAMLLAGVGLISMRTLRRRE
ncbi:MAG: hypothetical protein MUC79_07450 [Thiobacillaceae bacterium]|jgi:hypothetical protein|nr:hypothetical protein [Thiobacillaceae bacterium]